MRLQKKTNKKPLFIALALLIVIAIGVFMYFWLSRPQDESVKTTQQSSQQKTSQKNTGSTKSQKEASGTNSTVATPETPEKEKDITPAYEGTNPNSAPSLTGVITYSAVAGGKLIIRTNINQSVSSGTCELTLSQNSKLVTKTSDIALNPSSSTCQGFDIPVTELGSGKWDISIKLSGDNKSGTLTGSVNI